MFQSTNKQYLSTILFNILEELSLFNIFDINDIKNIHDIAIEKYSKLYEITKEATTKYLDNNICKQSLENVDENSSSNIYSEGKGKSDINYIFCDISEYKASILSLINTNYVLFYNFKNVSLAQMFYKVTQFIIITFSSMH